MGLELNAQLRMISNCPCTRNGLPHGRWLDKIFFVMGPEGEELSISDDIFYPHLAVVIIYLQKSKRAAEKHKVLGFPNCSFKDVHHQPSLAFEGSHEVSIALEEIEVDDIDSMAFPEQNMYKIVLHQDKGKHQIGKSK
jgi:hypothetical protein